MITLDSMSLAVELLQTQPDERTEAHCMAIGQRWADSAPIPWLPTQREMNALIRGIPRIHQPEHDDFHLMDSLQYGMQAWPEQQRISYTPWLLKTQTEILDDINKLMTKTWESTSKTVPPSDVSFFYDPAFRTGKSKFWQEWAEYKRKQKPAQSSTADKLQDYRLMSWDECSTLENARNPHPVLIDAPDSVNDHFLHRFHKVD